MRYLLDTSALLAHYRQESGGERAQAMFEADEAEIIMACIGEQVLIAKAGEPVAILSPLSTQMARRVPGNDTGKITITSAFDEPLPEFNEL